MLKIAKKKRAKKNSYRKEGKWFRSNAVTFNFESIKLVNKLQTTLNMQMCAKEAVQSLGQIEYFN